jgi:shikimate kinase
MNIFLIGYRGTGKTLVGNALAGRLNRPFVDADTRLVAAQGLTIAEMVAEQGWDYFRQKEKALIESICSLDGQIIATGGGVVRDPDNLTAMKGSGKLVWLRAAPQTIRKRIQQDKNTEDQRPALTSRGLFEEVEATLIERTPYYEAAMDFFIHTDNLTVDDICRLIITRLKGME